MFTVEMDFDETAVRILDDSGSYEDLELFLYDDIVIIRQWDEEEQNFCTLYMSPDMLNEMRESFNQSEGVYHMRKVKENK